MMKELIALERYIAQEDYAGYDPYDGLNSSLTRALSLGTKIGRIAIIQAVKRSPVNLRPLLGIRKGHNSKGIGLFLWGYAKLYGMEENVDYLQKINRLLALLEELKSEGYSGHCWGYNFDWQSRAFYAPHKTPTIVNSAFIGHALIDTFHATGIERALQMAVSIKDFLMHDLSRMEDGNTFSFSYTPTDHTAVHNANLLGASLLIRLYRYVGDDRIRDTALASLAYTMKYQQQDGSWYYGEAGFHHWIDSFHTGFNLQAIRYFLDAGEAEEYREGYRRGVEYYRDSFFLEDGTPKYYHDRTYPIDIHAPAQALAFFSEMGAEYRPLLQRVASWMLVHMQDPRGYFYFQIKSNYVNKIPYMRWAQAWAFHGLTSFAASERTTDPCKTK
jgi:rhamnogalacturonyl hydrolase YesR